MNRKGLYLVINPKQEQIQMLSALEKALYEGLAAVQIYNGWPDGIRHEAKLALCKKVNKLCNRHNTPCLINNEWELLKEVPLAGVHFDFIPENWVLVRTEINRPFYTGVTLNNDLSLLPELEKLEISYLSFCAMFPSASVGDCEIVHPETVQKTLSRVNVPVFLSGGITPQNAGNFSRMNISGVAVISGVMNAKNPAKAVDEYKKTLSKFIDL